MEKQIITFSANEQCLQKTGGVDCYASNTVAYIEARFDLGENWSGYDSVRAVWFTDFVGGISTVLDSQGVCVVPFEVLTRKSAVKVNLVGSIAENDVLTDRLTTCPVVALTIKCNAKTDGDNTQPITPSEYEQFVASVKTDADRAEAGAESAEASAQSASESATASANSATSSEQSATASAESAQNASESAISAENAKDDAESARDEILGMRATAETLAEGSQATASYSDGVLTLGIPRGDKGAKGDKGDTGATPNFSIGEVDTLEPNESATASITGTAENPVLNLGIPKGEQGDVNLSQLEALLPTETASGDIVSITDGQSVVPVKSLKVTLEPIQDLHGYDKPWAGGSGANKWDEEWETYGSSQIKSKNLIPLIAGATYYLKVPAGIGGTIYFKEDVDIPSSSSWSGANETFTVPSNIHYGIFYAGSGYGTTYNHDIAINYPSSVTTYSPYENICPITGHDSVTVGDTGVNQWDEEWELGYWGNGSKIASNSNIRSINKIPIYPNTTYYLKIGGSFFYTYYDIDGQFLPMSGYDSQGRLNKTTAGEITTPVNAYYMTFNMASAYGTTYNNDISINYPSTDHDYYAYQGATYTTTLGRTIYGGALDVVSGEMVVDRAMVDLGNVAWNYNSIYSCWMTSAIANDVKKYPTQAEMITAIAEKYVVDPVGILNGANFTAGKFILGTSGNLFVKTGSNSETPAGAFVYELANPQTYQLTPQEVELLLGTNNVWSDGDVTMTYNADIQRYIEKKLSGNSTTSMLSMSRPMVQTETEETEETAETE